MGSRVKASGRHFNQRTFATQVLVLAVSTLTMLCLQSACVPQADAVIARTNAGHRVSYQPTRSQVSRARRLAGAHFGALTTTGSPQRGAASYEPCNGASACLSYYGGPVMKTTTLTAVFWEPAGLSYPEHYKEEIEQFLEDIAADSGKETNVFSVLPQYYEKEEPSGKINHVSYSISVEPAQSDTAALPSGSGEKCTSPFSPSRPCVSDNGVKNQLVAFVKAHSALPTGIGHEYLVFFPPGMESCFGESGEAGEICSGEFYCGYHGAIEAGSSKEIEYANLPDVLDPVYKLNCVPESGLKAGYATTDTASHEISESITDPHVGTEEKLSWYDNEDLLIEPEVEVEYGEIGDMCAYEYQQGDSSLEPYFTHKLDSNGKPNQTINGHSYLLQLEWDNAHSTCSLSKEAASSKATFTDTDTGGVLTEEAISFDGTGSHGPTDPHISSAIKTYEWHWGDGTVTSMPSPTVEHRYTSTEGTPNRTFTVTLTAIDGNKDKASIQHTVNVEDRPPTAAFPQPSEAHATTGTQFDAAGSGDPDGAITQYAWNFGDGTTGEGVAPVHVYAAPGEYTVELTVTDDAGNTATVSHTVTVGAAPPPKTEGPSTGDTTTGGTQTTGGAGGGGNTGTPSNAIHVTGVKQNKKKGTAALTVSVPGAGLLSAREASGAHTSFVSPLAGALTAPTPYAIALASVSKGKAKGPFVKSVSLAVSSAGAVTLQIVPTAAGKTQLTHKHKLVVKLLLAFTPTGGTQGTLIQTVTLVLSAKHK